MSYFLKQSSKDTPVFKRGRYSTLLGKMVSLHETRAALERVSCRGARGRIAADLASRIRNASGLYSESLTEEHGR